jgi:hypothetical protein
LHGIYKKSLEQVEKSPFSKLNLPLKMHHFSFHKQHEQQQPGEAEEIRRVQRNKTLRMKRREGRKKFSHDKVACTALVVGDSFNFEFHFHLRHLFPSQYFFPLPEIPLCVYPIVMVKVYNFLPPFLELTIASERE